MNMNQEKTFLPYVANGPVLPHMMFLNTAELDIAALISNHPDQKRSKVIISRDLSALARAKTLEMATRGYTGHVNPEGIGPNEMVRNAHFYLPEWYGQEMDSNNVESLAWAGEGDVDAMWTGWLRSEPHKIHLLGLHDVFASQTFIGVGYTFMEDSQYEHYYCFLSVPYLNHINVEGD